MGSFEIVTDFVLPFDMTILNLLTCSLKVTYAASRLLSERSAQHLHHNMAFKFHDVPAYNRCYSLLQEQGTEVAILSNACGCFYFL